MGNRGDVQWPLLSVIVVVHFLDAFDGLAVSVSLPSIERAFALSTAQGQWVLNARFLTFGGLLLLGGRLADRWGRRRLFVFGLAAFAVGAMSAALSPVAGVLFLSRAVQGVGAAAAMPAAVGLLVAEHEGAARSRAFGVWAGAAGAAFVTGSVAGGLLTGVLGWQAVLLVEVAFACGAAAAGARLLPASRDLSASGQLDVIGAVLGTAALAVVLFGVSELGGATVPVPIAWIALAAGVVLSAVFVRHERTTPDPLIPVALFRSRARRGAYMVTVFHPVGVTGAVFVASLYLQRGLDYTAVEAGVGLLAFAVPITVLSPFTDRFVEQFNPRNGSVVGLALAAVGMTLLGVQARPGAEYLVAVLPGLSIAGVGVALAFVGLNVAAAIDIQQDAAGVNASVFKTADQTGGAVGVAVLAAVIAADGTLLGYRAAFLTTAGILAAGAALAQQTIRRW